MNYFSGLAFSQVGSYPEHRGIIHNEPSYYSIQFNYRGSLWLRINQAKEYRVEGAYAFLTYPGTVFEYGAIGQRTRCHNFLCAYGKRVENYVESGLFPRNPDNPLVRIQNPGRFLQTMQDIMALVRHPGATPPRAVLLFESLLLQMHEDAKIDVKELPYQADYLNALMQKIYDRPQEQWDFQREAANCHVTTTHFRRLFKRLAGLPPQQFLIYTRLRKAAEQLVDSSMPIKEIASLVGFDNVFYFSRLFSQKYQASPMAYRREFGRLQES